MSKRRAITAGPKKKHITQAIESKTLAAFGFVNPKPPPMIPIKPTRKNRGLKFAIRSNGIEKRIPSIAPAI